MGRTGNTRLWQQVWQLCFGQESLSSTVLQTLLKLINAPTWTSSNHTNLTLDDVGLIYPVNDMVEYTRPTLRKSGLLYFVFAIQPLLVFVSLASKACILNSTPLANHFGLISILSGIDCESLDVVNGASLSGQLATKVKLIMRPMRNSQGDTIRYRVMPSSSTTTPTMRNERLAPNTTYH